MIKNITQTLLSLPSNVIQLEAILDNLSKDHQLLLIQIIDELGSQNFNTSEKPLLLSEYLASYINKRTLSNVEQDKQFQFQIYWPYIEKLLTSNYLPYTSKKLLFKSGAYIIKKANWKDLDKLVLTVRDLFQNKQCSKHAPILIIEMLLQKKLNASYQADSYFNLFLAPIRETIQIQAYQVQNQLEDMTKNANEFLDETSLQVKRHQKQLIMFLTLCVDVYLDILSRIRSRLISKKVSSKFIVQELESNSFLSILKIIFNLKLNVCSQMSKIISTSKTTFDPLFNNLKKVTFEIHTLLLMFNNKFYEKLSRNQKSYLNRIDYQVEQVIQEIHNGYKIIHSQQKNNDDIENLVRAMLDFVRASLQYNIEILKSKESLLFSLTPIFYIGFKASSKQLTMYKQDSGNFITLNQYNYQSQNFEFNETKQATIRLLLCFMKKYPVANDFFTARIAQKLIKSFSRENPVHDINRNQEDIPIEAYLSMLSVIVYFNRQYRQKLSFPLVHLLNSQMMFRLQKLDLSRWFSIIVDNPLHFSQQNKEKYLKIALSQSSTDYQNSNNKDITLSFYCYRYIQKYLLNVKNIEPQIVMTLMQRILVSTNKYLFCFIKKIFKHHSEEEYITQQLQYYLLQLLFERIDKQYKKKNHYQDCKALYRCFQILLMMTDIYELTDYMKIQYLMQPINSMMMNLESIPYDEKLIEVYSSLIIRFPEYNSDDFLIFSKIVNFLDKNQKISPVFDSFVFFLMKGQKYIKTNPLVITRIVDSIIFSISNDEDLNDFKLYDIAKGYLLLQILVNKYDELVSQQQFSLLRKACEYHLYCKQLEHPNNIRKIKSKIINTWILCSLYSQHFGVSIITSIPYNNIGIYDMRVFIYAISKVFIQKPGQYLATQFLDVVCFCAEKVIEAKDDLNDINAYVEDVDVQDQIQSVNDSIFNNVNIIEICQDLFQYVAQDNKKFKDLQIYLMENKRNIEKYNRYKIVEDEKGVLKAEFDILSMQMKKIKICDDIEA